MKKNCFFILFSLLVLQLFSQERQRLNTVIRTSGYSSAPFYVAVDFPSTLNGLIARYRADDLQTIIDTNLNDASDSNFNGTVFQWLDISTNNSGQPNNRHLVAHNKLRTATDPSSSGIYVPNTVTSPPYRTNAKVRGISNGSTGDFLYVDIDLDNDPNNGTDVNLTGDFSFIFVMTAIDPNPTNFNSFIASSSGSNLTTPIGPQVTGAWQISTTTNRNNLYFLLRGNGTGYTFNLLPFDTSVHLYYIEYDAANTTLRISIDGNQVINSNIPLSNQPIIDELRLFRNRNLSTYISAEFHEFFLTSTLLNTADRTKLTQYLLAKWGI